jgi:Trk-type K+ transport system membrane component
MSVTENFSKLVNINRVSTYKQHVDFTDCCYDIKKAFHLTLLLFLVKITLTKLASFRVSSTAYFVTKLHNSVFDVISPVTRVLSSKQSDFITLDF